MSLKSVPGIVRAFQRALGLALVPLLLAACGATATAMPPPTAARGSAAATATSAVPAATTVAPTVTPVPVASAIAQPTTAVATGAPTAGSAASVAKFNLNTASDADLLKVPNSGARMLREFLEYRPYTSILQFRREIGKYVGAQQVAEYEKYLFVPIAPNASDADTLMQIPGLDKTAAGQVVAARPFASNDAFLQALAKYVSADAVTAAKSYLVAQ